MTSSVGVLQLPECSVCLNEIQENSKRLETACHHIFHRQCLHKWMTENEYNRCPNCRQATDMSFRALFEEDFTAIRTYQEALKSNNEAFGDRLASVIESAEIIKENLILLATFTELQTDFNSFLDNLSNACTEMVEIECKLQTLDAAIPERRDQLLANDSQISENQDINNLIDRAQRLIIFQNFPQQEEIEKEQSNVNVLHQKLETQVLEIERRFSEIEARVLSIT